MPIEPEGLTDAQIREMVFAQMAEDVQSTSACFLLTYRPDGFARLYGMGFLQDGWTYFMSTFRGMRKHLDIAASPRATILVQLPAVRRDHFVQIDCVPRELSADDLEPWQQRRFVRWPHELRLYQSQNKPWVGWLFHPVKIRVNGYVASGKWRETAIVFNRQDLGLPPLD
jgi:hypothetical protein